MESFDSVAYGQKTIQSSPIPPKMVDQDLGLTRGPVLGSDPEFVSKLEAFSLETIVEHKISRFLDQIGNFYPEDLHSLILGKVEKPLLSQILRRTGGNQVHASKILGINRNTLRKKMKVHGVKP